MTRDELVEKLTDREYGAIEWESIWEILKNGCIGYDNMDDETLKEWHKNYFDQEVEIVEA